MKPFGNKKNHNLSPKPDSQLAQENKWMYSHDERIDDVDMAHEMALAGDQSRTKAAAARRMGRFIRDLTSRERSEVKAGLQETANDIYELNYKGVRSDNLTNMQIDTLGTLNMIESSDTRKGKDKVIGSLAKKSHQYDTIAMNKEQRARLDYLTRRDSEHGEIVE